MPTVDNLDIQISTSLKNSDKMLDNLIKKLGTVSSSLSKVGGSTSKVSSGMKNISNTTTKTTKSFKGLASAFGKFYASYFLVIRGIKALYKSIEGTADYIEAFNYYTVAMGKVASKWDKNWASYGDENARNYSNSFVKTMNKTFEKLSGVQYDPSKGLISERGIKNLGLNIKEVTQYAAQLVSMMDAVGQKGEVTLATTDALTRLAGDLSSLYNIDYSSAATNIRSVLMGQSRAGYKFGWDTTAASLQALADSLNLGKAVSEMTQMEKQQLRILKILQDSRVAWGDQANTINNYANQIRLLKNNLKEAGIVLGQLFIPLLSKVLPIINGVTIAIKRLFGNIAGILGIELKAEDISSGFQESEDIFDGVSDSLDGVAESAKKAKAGLRGFDELKTINMPSGSGANSGLGGAIDLTNEIIKATEEYKKVWDEAYDKMEQRAQKFADMISKYLNPFESLFKNIKKGDWFAVGEDVSGIANNIFDLLNFAFEKTDWDGLGTNVGNFISGLLSNAFNGLPKVANLISNSIIAINTFLSSVINSTDWYNLTQSFVTGIAGFIKNLQIGEIVSSITDLITSIINATAQIINYIATNPKDFADLLFNLALALVELFVASFEQVIEVGSYSLTRTFLLLIENSLGAAEKNKDSGIKVGKSIRNILEEGIKSLGNGSFKEWLKEKLSNLITNAIKTMKVHGNIFAELFRPTIKSAKENFNELEEVIRKTFEKSGLEFYDFKNLLDKNPLSISVLIESIKDKTKEQYDKLVDWWNQKPKLSDVKFTLSNLLQSVKDAWNSVKNWWNKNVKLTIPKLNFKVTYKDAKNSLEKAVVKAIGLKGWPSFEFYETGGFPKSADLFWANENGVPELVGTMGGKTAVASGMEITGIKDAIYSTGQQEANLMGTMVGLLRIIADKEFGLTDSEIGKSAQRYAKDYFNRTGNEAYSF